jgi:hypothetical protein
MAGRAQRRPDKMALYIHSHFSGLGFAISAFEGRRTTG